MIARKGRQDRLTPKQLYIAAWDRRLTGHEGHVQPTRSQCHDVLGWRTFYNLKAHLRAIRNPASKQAVEKTRGERRDNANPQSSLSNDTCCTNGLLSSG